MRLLSAPFRNSRTIHIYIALDGYLARANLLRIPITLSCIALALATSKSCLFCIRGKRIHNLGILCLFQFI